MASAADPLRSADTLTPDDQRSFLYCSRVLIGARLPGVAHNRSPSKLRSDVMAAPLTYYGGWMLEVECGNSGCPVGRSHKVASLFKHYPGCTVATVIGRLRCIRCGRGPVSAVLVLAHPQDRLPLRGPEVRY